MKDASLLPEEQAIVDLLEDFKGDTISSSYLKKIRMFPVENRAYQAAQCYGLKIIFQAPHAKGNVFFFEKQEVINAAKNSEWIPLPFFYNVFLKVNNKTGSNSNYFLQDNGFEFKEIDINNRILRCIKRQRARNFICNLKRQSDLPITQDIKPPPVPEQNSYFGNEISDKVETMHEEIDKKLDSLMAANRVLFSELKVLRSGIDVILKELGVSI